MLIYSTTSILSCMNIQNLPQPQPLTYDNTYPTKGKSSTFNVNIALDYPLCAVGW